MFNYFAQVADICVRFYPVPQDYETAKSLCEANNAELATMPDPTFGNLMFDFFKTSNWTVFSLKSDDTVWLGAKPRSNNFGDWIWEATGKEMDSFNKWKAGSAGKKESAGKRIENGLRCLN